MTQAELARRVGCRQCHVSSIERAERWPSVALLLGISDALDTDVCVLFQGGDEESAGRHEPRCL